MRKTLWIKNIIHRHPLHLAQIIFFTTCLFSNLSYAENKHYLTFGIGHGIISEDGLSIGNVYSVKTGYRFNHFFRSDLELNHHPDFTVDGKLSLFGFGLDTATDIESKSAFINLYYDIPFAWVNAFIGAGIGYSEIKLNRIKISGPFFAEPLTISDGNTENTFAWQLMAGFSYKLTARSSLSLSYHYRDMGIASSSDINYQGIEIPAQQGDLRSNEISLEFSYLL